MERPQVNKIPHVIHKTTVLYGVCYRFGYWDKKGHSYLLYQTEQAQTDLLKRWKEDDAELLPFTLELPSPDSLRK